MSAIVRMLGRKTGELAQGRQSLSLSDMGMNRI